MVAILLVISAYLLLWLSYKAGLVEEEVWHRLHGSIVAQNLLQGPGSKDWQRGTAGAKPPSPCCQQSADNNKRIVTRSVAYTKPRD